MALRTDFVKVPHRARTTGGQVVRGAELYIYLRGTTTEAPVYAAQSAALTDTLEQPLRSLQDGSFPGYVQGGRYDAVLDGGTARAWDAHVWAAGPYWRTINTSGNPNFSNSWVNYGSGYAVAAFCKDSYGIVRLRGVVKNGTVSTTIFTLPAGYCPDQTASARYTYSVASLGTAGSVAIDNTGAVIAPGYNTFVPLDGISFPAEA